MTPSCGFSVPCLLLAWVKRASYHISPEASATRKVSMQNVLSVSTHTRTHTHSHARKQGEGRCGFYCFFLSFTTLTLEWRARRCQQVFTWALLWYSVVFGVPDTRDPFSASASFCEHTVSPGFDCRSAEGPHSQRNDLPQSSSTLLPTPWMALMIWRRKARGHWVCWALKRASLWGSASSNCL